MKKRKKATIYPIVKVLFLVAVLVMGGSVISLQLQISDLQAQRNTLQDEVERKEQQNKEFEDSIKEGNTDESIAKIARDVLGYASTGEKVYVDSSEQ